MIPASIAILLTGAILLALTREFVRLCGDATSQPAWRLWVATISVATSVVLVLVGALWFIWSNVV